MLNLNSIVHKLKTTVTVVTAKHDNIKAGLTIAWITPVSFNPWTVAFSIAPERFSHKIIAESQKFSVNILGEEHDYLAKHFGLQSGSNTDKFENIVYEESEDGFLHLNDCIAWFDCNVTEAVQLHTHTIFIGEIINGKIIKENSRPQIMDYDKYFGVRKSE